jgi:hypothetical protein
MLLIKLFVKGQRELYALNYDKPIFPDVVMVRSGDDI